MTKKTQSQMQWLFLRNNKASLAPSSKQTQIIRDRTNLKIRELGCKYFNVKRLFDQLNLRRDFLFNIGKELEQEFKKQKAGISLQTQSRRSKEALICWYTEFFYSEIFTPNSPVLEKLINVEQSKEQAKRKINQNNDHTPQKREIIFDTTQKNNERKQESQKSLLLDDLTFNKEIDSFDYKNEMKNTDNDISNRNLFDYDELLKFIK